MRLLLVVALLAGCHAKFKREAPGLGAVRTQVINTGGPYVVLGGVGGDGSLAGAIVASTVNIVQAVRAEDQVERIENAVRIDSVNQAMGDGIHNSLGDGPPFAWTDRPDAALLSLEVESYGLFVPHLGAPGEFTYEVRALIYKPDGDRVYKARTTCSTGAGDPDSVAMVFSVVNNVRELKLMTDEQINQSFQSIAAWCGEEIVRKMRKHAG